MKIDEARKGDGDHLVNPSFEIMSHAFASNEII